jgi:biotin carboxyl carrier protein
MATYEYLLDGKTVDVQIEGKDGQFQVTAGDRKFQAEACRLSDSLLSVAISGELMRAFVAERNRKTFVNIEGKTFAFDDATAQAERQKSGRSGVGLAPGAISSPMPGNVIKLLVKEGDTVKEGQSLVIVEAMKMENEIRSPSNGVVKKINFAVGNLVEAGAPIVELETNNSTGFQPVL